MLSLSGRILLLLSTASFFSARRRPRYVASSESTNRQGDGCPWKVEWLSKAELGFNWRADELCRLRAGDVEEERRCPRESRKRSKSRACGASTRNHESSFVRLRRAGIPNDDESPVRELSRLIGRRTLLWIGDSASQNMIANIGDRAKDIGNATFQREAIFGIDHVPELYGPPSSSMDPSEVWAKFGRMVRDRSLANPAGSVVVVNAGLHYGDVPRYARALRGIYDALGLCNRAHPANVCIFAETTAQHFPTSTGGYKRDWDAHRMTAAQEERHAAWLRDASDALAYHCTPYLVLGHDCHTRSWRNEVAHNVSRDFPDLAILPTYHITDFFWDMHYSSISVATVGKEAAMADSEVIEKSKGWDCTHFCYTPAIADGLAYELNLILRPD